MKKIFIICSVRGINKEYREKLEEHTLKLLNQGYKVHLPYRDTDQTAKGIDICTQNMLAISDSDEVHIFYNSESQGTHFDMGVAFALGKKIVIIENEEFGESKSFPRMLTEWESEYLNVEELYNV